MPEEDKTEFLVDLFDQAQGVLEGGRATLASEIISLKENYGKAEFFAQGGMKLIYEVRDLKSDRTVAMAKLPKDADEAQIENFFREARLTAKLQHPNIIPVYDIGTIKNEPYFTMKFLEGSTLEKIITNLINETQGYAEKYNLPELLRIFQNVCNAVAYAHTKGVIHLDLKPANIHVSNYGEVTVCDWGLAKVIDEEVTDESFDNYSLDFLDLKNQTINGYVKGTPGYLAPEQIKAVTPKDKRTDIYALGAILYNILTLRKVIEEKDNEAYKEKLFSNQVKDPIKLKPDIPPRLNAITTKCISMKPDDRYQNIDALLNDLKAFNGGISTETENEDMLTLLKLLISRNKVIALSSILLLIILSGALSFYLLRMTGEETDKIKNYENLIAEEKLRLEVSKGSAQEHKAEAQRLYDEGKLESALLNLETAISINPDLYGKDELLRKCLIASGHFKRLNSLKYQDAFSKWVNTQIRFNDQFFKTFFTKLKSSGDEKLYRLAQRHAYKPYFTGNTDLEAYLKILIRIDNPELKDIYLEYNGRLLNISKNKGLQDIEAINSVYFTDLNLSSSTIQNIDKINYQQLNTLNLSFSRMSSLPNWKDANLTYLDISYCLFDDFKNVNNYSIATFNCRGIYIPITEVFKNERIQKIMVSSNITMAYSESSNKTLTSRLLKYEEYPKMSMQRIRYAQFVNMDHNGDKVLSNNEFLLSPKLFTSWDFNNDGLIQVSEIMQYPRPVPSTSETKMNFIKVGNIECMDTEVTNAQFCRFLNENKKFFHDTKGVYLDGKLVYYYFNSAPEYESKISFVNKKFEVKGGFENYPANFVTYYGAKAFASYHSGRLMTEKDYKTIRQSNSTKYLTASGRLKENSANFFSYILKLRTYMPLPVKFYRPTQNGFYGLVGNLREWGDLKTGTETSEKAKVYGGSFLTIPEWVQPAKAQSLSTQYCDSHTGFRVIKDLN